MLVSEREERASRLAEELIRKCKGDEEKALVISLGLRRVGNIQKLTKGLNSKTFKNFSKELYIFFALNEIEKLIRKLKYKSEFTRKAYATIGKLDRFFRRPEIQPMISQGELINSVTLPFPGGVLNLISRTEEGYSATAHPLSHLSGTEVQAHILARMLKGFYPDHYSDQGDLIWKSILMRTQMAKEKLRSLGIDGSLTEALSLEAAIRSTKLWPIFAILMVEDSTEAYAQLNGSLVIEHIIHGRIRVKNCIFDEEELSKFMTFVEADPSSGFEYRSSLAEVDLSFSGNKFRIALDVPPSSRGALDVRNLSAMRKLSLPRLIELRSITEEQASAILTNLERGSPILIFGRTGVGKTTLANAILAVLPRDWRIISIEETREIEDLSLYGMHHSPYEVPGKLEFIRFLLHRNPDLVFLGEILTKDQAQAFELASTSGLKTIATCHAKDFEGLERKWESWGLKLPQETLGVFMVNRRVERVMKWDGSWSQANDFDGKWLLFLAKLKGANTNEEVGRRVCELEGLVLG